MLPQRTIFLAGLFLSLSFTNILADENWGLCRIPSFEFVDAPDLDQSATEIQSERMSQDNNNLIKFSGQVELLRTGQRIRADQLIIDSLTEQLQASGQIVFEDASFRLQA